MAKAAIPAPFTRFVSWNTHADKYQLAPGEFADIQNMYICRNTGKPIKKAGRTSFTTEAALTGRTRGIHRFVRSNGNKQFIFAHSTKLYSVDDSTGVRTQIGTGFTDAREWYFDTMKDLAIGVNGIVAAGADVPQKWDGTTLSNLGGTPGVARYVKRSAQANRLILLSAATPAQAKISDIDDPESFPNTLDFSSKGGEWLTGVGEAGSKMLFMTQNKLFSVDDLDLTSLYWSKSKISDNEGCASFRSVVSWGSNVYWWGKSNVWMYKQGIVYGIGIPMQPLISRLNKAILDQVCAAVFNDRIYFCLPLSASSAPNYTVIWDCLNERWIGQEDMNIQSFAVTDEIGNDAIYGGDSTKGHIYQLEKGSTDDGTAIDVMIETGFDDQGDPNALKYYDSLSVPVRQFGGTLTVRVDVDQGTKTSQKTQALVASDVFGTGVFDTAKFSGNTFAVVPMRIHLQGYSISLKISVTGSNDDFSSLNPRVSVKPLSPRRQYAAVG